MTWPSKDAAGPATFFDSHSVDSANRVQYAVDLSELIADASISVEAFVESRLRLFSQEIVENIQRVQK